ncbi:2-hydroxyacyl-CoA dehydratase [Proteinivorax hydrogeniformans]|uniref:2-hydroxyacyl-CoA dehydratase n=1 Tax=Proteinivorax hydrogeniformans TaxID=1826727 RepID=A0AAU8HRC3_9FIRM
MKVAFPYMGTTVIYKKLLELLGNEVVMPPKPSQRTIDLGVKYSPEFACFPLKVITGSYIEAIEKGADTLVTSGGHGPCRAGFYEKVHKRLLEEEGFDADFIVFNSPYRDLKNFLQNVKKVKGDSSLIKALTSLNTVFYMIKKLDDLEKKAQKIRAYEKTVGQTTKVWEEIQILFDGAYTKKEMEKAYIQAMVMLDNIDVKEVKDHKRLRIGIVGEIYVVMEPTINIRMEEMLGNLGVEVERSQYLYDWVCYSTLSKMPLINKTHEKKIVELGEQYIPINIGGHARQSVGHIVDYQQRGFDGVVHLMPFGCLPELVSQSIIPKISDELNIPVLSLSIDEQTGVANTLTRVEAFVDLIKGRKNKKIS